MAIEYAGYIPATNQVNWESLTDKFASKVETAITARKEERISLDKIAADNEKMIKEQQLGKTEALNEFITKEGFKGKNFINNLNKELKLGHITPQQYKVAMNNVTENWGVLASSAKTYDDRRQAIYARQQQDKDGNIAGSSYEVELQKLNEEALDLANNSTQWTSNGNLYLGKTDKEGKLVGELNDVRSLNKLENILVNRVNVNKNVTTFTNEWKANKKFQDVGKEGSITIEDVRLKPEFKLATLYLAESIAPDSDPKRQISVLVDNGVIEDPEYYFKDGERQSKIDEKIAKLAEYKSSASLPPPTADEIADIELSLVKLVKKPNGVTDPELTPKQQKAVKDRIISEVELQFASEVTGKAQDVPAPIRSSGSGSESGSGSGNNNDGVEGWKLSQKIFSDDVGIGKTSGTENNSSTMSVLASKNPGLLFNKVKWSNGAVGIHIRRWDKDKGRSGEWVDDKNITTPKELAPYIYGTTNYDKAFNTWQETEDRLGGKPKQGNNSGVGTKYN